MADDVKSLVQMLDDLPPGGILQVPAVRLTQLFDADAEVGEGILANLQAFAGQRGCRAEYKAESKTVTFTKASSDQGEDGDKVGIG